MSDVKQTFSGDASALHKALADLSRDYVRLENRLDKLTQASRRGADEAVRDSQRRRAAFADEARVFQSQRAPSGNPWASAHVQSQRLAAQAANPWISAQRDARPVLRITDELMQSLDAAGDKQAQVNGLWNSGAGALGRLAAGFLTVGAVAQAYNRDLERQIQLQMESLAAHRALAGGQAEMYLNTFGESAEAIARRNAAAQRISAATGVPEHVIAQTIARQSGRGVGLSAEQVIEATGIAARLGRHTPEQIEPLGTVIQQTMRATGKSGTWSAALAQSAAAAAFPGNPTLQARFLQQTLTGSLANINEPDAAAAEQVMEIGAWLSQAGGEERGEAGRTATIRMLAQFDEFREGRGPWAISRGGRKFNPAIKDAPTRPLDFVEWLRSNPGQMKRFFDRATFEAHYEGIIRRGIMQPESQVGRLLADTIAEVKPDEGALEQVLQRLERGTPQITQSALDAEGQTAVEQYKARATRPAVTASLRKLREEAFAAASRHRHLTPVEVGIMSHGFDTPLGHLPGLRDTAGYLKGQQAEYFLGDIKAARDELLQGGLFGKRPDQLGAEQKAVYDLLTKLIENGEKQLEELKKLTKPQPTGGHHAVERGRHSEK